MKILLSTIVLCTTALLVDGTAIGDELSGYYTEINSGAEFERLSRTGPYADIVVEVGAGKLVFWRGTSYLPYWETADGKWPVEEIVPRHGDGPKQRPDRVNKYSRISLIESNPDRVLVCWRYLPEFQGTNPHFGVDATKFVEELYSITGDGKVTRTIRQGTPKVDEWRDPQNKIIQTFELAAAGIVKVRTNQPQRTAPADAVVGKPVQENLPGSPVAWWRFDEAQGDKSTEVVSGFQSDIAGHKSLWKPGVSGTALQFDGYNTKVSLPSATAPSFSTAITVEAWVAIGAYPWSWTPFVQQTDDPPEQLIAVTVDEPLLTAESEKENQ